MTRPDGGHPLYKKVLGGVERAVFRSPWPAHLAERLRPAPPIRVAEQRVNSPRPLGDAATLRIAFASDFHAGPMTPPGVLAGAIEALRSMPADLVLLGGDFVDFQPEPIHRLCKLMEGWSAPCGIYAVLGNHDRWAGADEVVDALTRVNVRVLINEAVTLPEPFSSVQIVGMDDHQSGRPALPDEPPPNGGLRLVLMHAPSGLLDLGASDFLLAMAGHVHGGQVALPSGRPIVVPKGKLSRRYPGGFYPLEAGRHLLVSRGVGRSGLPIRWNAPAEIHRIEIVHP